MEGTAENNIENGTFNQTDRANPFNPENKIPSRQDILLKLYNRSLWIADKIDNSHTKLNDNLKIRVGFAKVECQFYSAILDGLKDVELDELAAEVAELKAMMEKKGNQ